MNAPAQRDARGRLLPGSTANPSGRPRVVEAVREMAAAHAPAALAKIAELIGSPDPRVALAASQEILNRYAGKPVQPTEADVRTLNMNQAYLDAMKLVNLNPPRVATDDTFTVELTPSPDEPVALLIRLPVDSAADDPTIEMVDLALLSGEPAADRINSTEW
jgi:hypothetical protein